MIEMAIEKYIDEYTTPEDKVMKSLNRETHLKTYYPNMLSGNIQGKLLEMISLMIKPKRILEIGTFTGYSAIALAKGLAEGGKIITIEVNEELESFIQRYLKKASVEDRVEVMIGNAIEIIPALNEEFDLIFIDADKEQYVDYFELAITKLKPGGFIIADNVLWSGKVLEDDAKSDKESMGIKNFNARVKNDNRVEQLILSVRDGLYLIRKL